MKMASRNVANMHLFLEMKTKFPHLPEDTLRNYVLLYAQDQAKCMSLLQKESENHFHPSKQFSDFRFMENKTSLKNGNLKENPSSLFVSEVQNGPFQADKNSVDNRTNIRNSNCLRIDESNSISNEESRNSKVGHPLTKSKKFTNASRHESHSAPVMDNSERPFINMFKSIPDSSHSIRKQIPSDNDYHNRMMFSTTKEHIIQPSEPTNNAKSSHDSSNSNNLESSKRHAVKLSITPALPFQQQQLNVYSNAICATATHSSRPGRHTTSLNFQLQPQTSDKFPLEISTVPTNREYPCNYRDFSSHVQISVDAQSTTFTAVRLQRPPSIQNQSIEQSSGTFSQERINHSQPSSQSLNFKTAMFPASVENTPIKDRNKMCDPRKLTFKNNTNSQILSPANQQIVTSERDFQTKLNQSNEFNAPVNYGPSYKVTSDYIQAVKIQQKAQLNLVQEELNKAKSICSNLKSEVGRMEQELRKRKGNKISCESDYYAELIKKLKEENRQLSMECNCLLMEYDMFTKEQEKNYLKHELPTPEVKVTDYEEDEKNSWTCKKCTYINHPALEKCEMCEISKSSGSFFDDN